MKVFIKKAWGALTNNALTNKASAVYQSAKNKASNTISWVKNTVSEKLSASKNTVAVKLDASFSESYPLPAAGLNKVGVPVSRMFFGVARLPFSLSWRLGGALVGGVRSFNVGAWNVIATFLPMEFTTESVFSLRPAIPKVIRAISNRELRPDFMRATSRNLSFFLKYMTILQWPTALYLNLSNWIRSNPVHNPERNPDNENQANDGNSIFTVENLLIVVNLAILLKYLGYKYLLSKSTKDHFYPATLDSMIINDKLPIVARQEKLVDDKAFEELKKVIIPESQNNALDFLSADIIQKITDSVKKIIGAKIFTNIEPLIQDTVMLLVLTFNNKVIGSKFIEVTSWLIRAYILGKDLGTSRLVAEGISDTQIRRIQGHSHFRFLGEGTVHLALSEASFRLLYGMVGLFGFRNLPVLSIPVNSSMLSLSYTVSMVAAHTQKIELREFDWKEKGINFNFYKAVIDWLTDEVVTWAERELGISNKSEVIPETNKEKLDDISDFIDLAELQEISEAFGVSAEQFLRETPSGEARAINLLQIIRDNASYQAQQYLHYLNLAKNLVQSEGVGCVPMVTQSLVNGARGLTKVINDTVPGGTTAVGYAAAATSFVVGTPAVVAGASVYAASRLAEHGDAIVATTNVASNMIRNLAMGSDSSVESVSSGATSSGSAKSIAASNGGVSSSSPKALAAMDAKGAAEISASKASSISAVPAPLAATTTPASPTATATPCSPKAKGDATATPAPTVSTPIATTTSTTQISVTVGSTLDLTSASATAVSAFDSKVDAENGATRAVKSSITSEVPKAVVGTAATPAQPAPLTLPSGSIPGTPSEIKSLSEAAARDTTAKASPTAGISPEEKEQWQKFMKTKLTESERPIIQKLAPDLILILEIFLRLRKKGSAFCLDFVSYAFPPRFRWLIKAYLKEFNDEKMVYRVEQVISFLYINQKSYLSKPKKPKVKPTDGNDPYVLVKADSAPDGTVSARSAEISTDEKEVEDSFLLVSKVDPLAKPVTENNDAFDPDVERMDITPAEIARGIKVFRLATAIALSGKTGTAGKQDVKILAETAGVASAATATSTVTAASAAGTVTGVSPGIVVRTSGAVDSKVAAEVDGIVRGAANDSKSAAEVVASCTPPGPMIFSGGLSAGSHSNSPRANAAAASASLALSSGVVPSVSAELSVPSAAVSAFPLTSHSPKAAPLSSPPAQPPVSAAVSVDQPPPPPPPGTLYQYANFVTETATSTLSNLYSTANSWWYGGNAAAANDNPAKKMQ